MNYKNITDAETGYAKYRGKCKQYVGEAVNNDPTLIAVRGHYICPFWGPQPHWWCVRTDGTIFDPTVDQFPMPHVGDYIPFDGFVECAECGKRMPEENASFYGNYAFCSGYCVARFVGV